MFSQEELNRFYRYCIALTGDEVEAYDLLQDGLEKYLRRGGGITSSKAYFRQIIRNHFIDRYRETRKHEMIELDENIISLKESDLEGLVISEEQTKIILEELGVEDRELLYLWAVEEHTTRELADLFDRPHGTILSKLHRLKIKLIDFLQKEGHGKRGYEKNLKRKHSRALPEV